MKKRLLPLFLAGVLSVSGFAGCGTASKEDESNKTTESTKQENKEEQDASNTPKYVFLFIGDGMSYPQVQLTNYFVSASKGQSGKTVDVEGETNSILENKNNLTMMDFDVLYMLRPEIQTGIDAPVNVVAELETAENSYTEPEVLPVAVRHPLVAGFVDISVADEVEPLVVDTDVEAIVPTAGIDEGFVLYLALLCPRRKSDRQAEKDGKQP